MKSTALRIEIEQSLADRIPSALTVRAKVERVRVSCGIEAIDQILNGGMPVGAITELVGDECSGRSTTAVSVVAELSRQGTVCAWVDVSDTFDPETAAANGMDLDRLLWVRCRNAAVSPGLPEKLSQSNTLSPSAIQATTTAYQGGGSPHPRSEGRGMPQAIQQLLSAQPWSAAIKEKRRDRSIGTPGVPNRTLIERVEQVSWDRLPPRRGENAQPNLEPRCAEPQHVRRREAAEAYWQPPPHNNAPLGKEVDANPWEAIDRALRTTDLLLQGGGFGAIVMDLGSTQAQQAWRIPLSSWFRFRAACERSQTILIVLTQHPCARSSAEVVVHMHRGTLRTDANVMSGIEYRAEVERQRFVQPDSNVVALRKPVQREQGTQWIGRMAWAK